MDDLSDCSVSVRMMSGEVMTFSVGSLLELQVMVAERTKVSVEFLQLLQGQQVLCDVDLKSLKSLGNGGEIAELSCIICPSVPLIIKLLKKEDFHFRGLNETATKTPQGITGCNLLHASVLVGRLELVRFLLVEEDFNGINNFLGRSGYNALHLAAKDGHSAICQELLDCERFLAANASTTCEGTALHVAAQYGNIQVLTLLLDSEHFTAINEAMQVPSYHQDCRGRCGQTALHVAAVHGQQQAAQVLLDHPRFTQVGAVTKTFKDAAAAADAAGHPSLGRFIRDHPKVRQFRRMPNGAAGYGGLIRRQFERSIG